MNTQIIYVIGLIVVFFSSGFFAGVLYYDSICSDMMDAQHYHYEDELKECEDNPYRYALPCNKWLQQSFEAGLKNYTSCDIRMDFKGSYAEMFCINESGTITNMFNFTEDVKN